MKDGRNSDDGVRAETLIADVRRLASSRCASGCGRALCGHELLMSFVSGFKNEPRCSDCLARAMGQDASPLRGRLVDVIRRRDCFSEAWEWTTDVESACDLASATPDQKPAAPIARSSASDDGPTATWDAGDLSCGDLVLELRVRLRAMRPGETLLLTATDPGAPEDIPAWCGLTGHALTHVSPPTYLIRRKDD